MMIAAEIEAILSDAELAAKDFGKAEAIEQLAVAYGWPVVCDAILNLLVEDRKQEDYEVAAQVIWSAIHEEVPLPADRVIASLYFRFDPNGDREDNLVWSITSSLRGVGYLSDYNPLRDPKVQAESALIKRSV